MVCDTGQRQVEGGRQNEVKRQGHYQQKQKNREPKADSSRHQKNRKTRDNDGDNDNADNNRKTDGVVADITVVLNVF